MLQLSLGPCFYGLTFGKTLKPQGKTTMATVALAGVEWFKYGLPAPYFTGTACAISTCSPFVRAILTL